MHGVLGKAAVDSHPRSAVTFLNVAVVQTRRVHAQHAVVAAATATMRLDGDALANGQLVHALTERRHGAGPLVARREFPKWRLVRERMRLQFQIRAAGPAHRNPDQDLARTRLGHRLVDHAQVVRSIQDGSPHAGQVNLIGRDRCQIEADRTGDRGLVPHAEQLGPLGR